VCGRYTSTTAPADLAEHFGVEEIKAEPLDPSWNVAPTQDVYAIAERGGVRQMGTFRWGLVPSWAKNPSVGAKMINARAEGLATKPAYRAALIRRRCIIPADGFYEWQVVEAGPKPVKQPYAIRHRDGRPLAFAGLWEVWRDPTVPDGDGLVRTCAIITTAANELLAPVHNRMPVVLPPESWSTWLDREFQDSTALSTKLVAAPSDHFELWPVGTLVNHAQANGPELWEPR
jgi:putative SOS response-associated peptidase YedK